ncbi:hypothetical protein BESB_002490 [Besnoitia besnoiti]|uniref:Transmembrane protein n=1 Tax=Besnoitia besnoiti TaxID=94643 RepID=A0A2A9MH97_BESBE|nr:hypothetical protein BESB_002490 [Besnoitia besnoiti]PFH37908.1 hypothetical protein BESB_002490 [Besnoitia besnoiti]
MALGPLGRLLLPWRPVLLRRRPRLFFFVCGAGCAYSAVNGSNPLSVIPLCCCYSYDLVALACPPLQLRRALFYLSLSRGVRAFGLDSPLLDRYLLFRLCSHVQQIASQEPRGGAAALLPSRDTSSVAAAPRHTRLSGELKRMHQLRCTYTPLPAVVDCLHHLVLSLERFYPGAYSLNLQEVYATLLPTLVLLGRQQAVQDDLKVPLFVQLSESIQVSYSPPPFFAVAPSAAAPPTTFSQLWGLTVGTPRRDDSRAFSTASSRLPGVPGGVSAALQAAGTLPWGLSFSSSLHFQHQHNRLLLQLLHLGLLSSQRALQFAEAAVYERCRPAVELPTLLSPRVLLDASTTQPSDFHSRCVAAAAFSPPRALQGGATSPEDASAPSASYPGPSGSFAPGDWDASVLSRILAGGQSLGETVLQQWRQLMLSFSNDLAASCAARARRATAGGAALTLPPSSTARVATAAAAEPKTLVGICAALATFLAVPFLPAGSSLDWLGIDDGGCGGVSGALQAGAPKGADADEGSLRRLFTGAWFFPSANFSSELPGVTTVVQPLRDQLLLLQQRQQRQLIVLQKPAAVAAAAAEFWEQLQSRGAGKRIHALVWVDRRGETAARRTSPALEQLEGSERLLVAAVRRGLDDLNWPTSASCLTLQQRRLLLPSQAQRLEQLRYLVGSRANAAMRTPHRLHAYDKSYDDFSTRCWLWQQFNSLKEEAGGMFLGCCAVAAAAALGGVLAFFFLRQSCGGGDGGGGASLPESPGGPSRRSWSPWGGLSRLLWGRAEARSPPNGAAAPLSRESGCEEACGGQLVPLGDPVSGLPVQADRAGLLAGGAGGGGECDDFVTAYAQHLWGLQRDSQDASSASPHVFTSSLGLSANSSGHSLGCFAMNNDGTTVASDTSTPPSQAFASRLACFAAHDTAVSSFGGPLGGEVSAGFGGAEGAAPSAGLPPAGLCAGRDELTSLYLALAGVGRGHPSEGGGHGRGFEYPPGPGGFPGSYSG